MKKKKNQERKKEKERKRERKKEKEIKKERKKKKSGKKESEVSCRIWTQVTDSMSYDDNRYTKCALLVTDLTL